MLNGVALLITTGSIAIGESVYYIISDPRQIYKTVVSDPFTFSTSVNITENTSLQLQFSLVSQVLLDSQIQSNINLSLFFNSKLVTSEIVPSSGVASFF